MIILPYKRQHDIVESAVLSGEQFRAQVVLILDGEDLSGRLEFQENGTWGQDEIPLSLDFGVAGVLGRRFEDARCELYVELEGVRVPQMVGHVTTPTPGGASPEEKVQTSLLSASAGALLPRTTLDVYTQFQGVTPEYIVRDAVNRVGVYDRGQINIDPLGTPIFQMIQDQGFTPQETARDILSRIVDDRSDDSAAAKVPYLFRDTPRNGFNASIDNGLGTRTPVRSYSATDIPDWVAPERKAERYSSVIVFRENEGATGDSPHEERYAIFELAPVNYNRPVRPAFAHTGLYIPFEDTSADGPLRARQLAYDRATILGRGIYGGSISLPSFDPLVERGDTYQIYEMHRDDDALWDRQWLISADGFSHTFDAFSLGTEVSYSGTLIQEDPIRAPAFINPSAMGQLDALLIGDAGDEIFFSLALEGVHEDGDEIVFDDELREVFGDGDELVVLMPVAEPRGLSGGVLKAAYGNEDGELYFSTDVLFVEPYDETGSEIIVYESPEVSLDGDEVVIS